MSEPVTVSQVWADIKQHPAWCIAAFLLWVVPATLFQSWSAFVKDKSFPEWLASHGLKFWEFLIVWLIPAISMTAIMVSAFIRRRKADPIDQVQSKDPVLLTHSLTNKQIEPGHEDMHISPNVVFRRGNTVGAHEEGSYIVEGNNGRDLTFHAVVAEFNNRVDSEHSTIPTGKVSATVRYDSFDDRKPIEVDRGIWLNDGSTADFDINDTKRLLIATLEGDFEARSIYAVDGSYSESNHKRLRLSEPLTQVQVLLIGQRQRRIIKKFDFMLEVCRDSDFLATFSLTDLGRWKYYKLFDLLVRGNNLLNEYTSERNFAALRGLAAVGWDEAADKIEKQGDRWATDASRLLSAHFSEQHQFKLIKAVSAKGETYDLEQTIKDSIRVIHETLQELDGVQPTKEDLKRFVRTFGPFA